MDGVFPKHHVLCCPLIAVDVISSDYNRSPSRAARVMKGLIVSHQNNQRSFPMPEICLRISAPRQGSLVFEIGFDGHCGQAQTIYRRIQVPRPSANSGQKWLASTTAALSRMAYQGSYYILWTQQTYLFNEIDLLKYHIADIERQLLEAQQTLNHPDTKRLDRRKAKWVANSQRKYLTQLERALHSLLRSLSACQAQIARIHFEASWQADKHANAWTMYHDPYYSNPTPTQETYQSQVRSSSPDSGFSEPALYAQSFDLDLTEDQATHVFSHELQHPLPLVIRTQIVEQTSTPIQSTPVQTTLLSPSADNFTPMPNSSHKAISPLAAPFSPFVFAKANPPGPNSPINARPSFTQPVWTSPFDWSEQVDEEMTPVSPRAKTEEQELKKGSGERYSVAAIELIESRLKHKRQISDVARRLMVQG